MANLNQFKDKNICIIGLMGSGKTIIGKNLSKLYKRQHFDTDKLIEEECKKSISDIFREKGELFFRKIEEKFVLNVLQEKKSIISLGGGSILSSKVRKKLKQKAITVYLKVDIKELQRRLINSKKRPLLNNGNLKHNLENILKNRKKFYDIADFTIENNNDAKTAISEIINKFEKNEIN